MTFPVSTRLATALVLAGIVFNFIFFSLSLKDAGEALSGWRETADESRTTDVDSERLGKFLGIQSISATRTVEAGTRPVAEAAELGRFTYQGKTYRLTGLIVGGSGTAATLLDDAGEILRLGPGDKIPSGETIATIALNEIVLVSADGSRASVEIY